jgi:hypothetical protein
MLNRDTTTLLNFTLSILQKKMEYFMLLFYYLKGFSL